MQFVATKELSCIRNYSHLNVMYYAGLYIYYDNDFEIYSDDNKTILLSGIIFNKDISEVTLDFNSIEFGPVLIYIDHKKDNIYFLNDKFKIVTLLYTEGNKSVVTNNWMFLNPKQFPFNNFSIELVKYNPRLHCILYNGSSISTKKVFNFDITHDNDFNCESHTKLVKELIESNVSKILDKYKKPLFMCSPKGVDSNFIAQCIEKTGKKVSTYTRWRDTLTDDLYDFYKNITDKPTIRLIEDDTPEKNANKHWSLNGSHAWHYFLDNYPDELDYDCILLGTNGDNAIPHTAEMAFSVDNYTEKERNLINMLKQMNLSQGLTPFHLRVITEWAKKYSNMYYFNDKGILGFIGYLKKRFTLLDCMYFVENIGYIQELGLQKNKVIMTPFFDTRLYQLMLRTKKEELRYILNNNVLIKSVLEPHRLKLIDTHRNQQEGKFEMALYNISDDFKYKLLKIYQELTDLDNPRIKDKLTALNYNLADRDSFELLLRYNFKNTYEKNSVYPS